MKGGDGVFMYSKTTVHLFINITTVMYIRVHIGTVNFVLEKVLMCACRPQTICTFTKY